MNGTYTVENILLQTQPHKPMDCAEGYKVASAVDCIVLLPLFTEYRIMEFRYNFHDSTFLRHLRDGDGGYFQNFLSLFDIIAYTDDILCFFEQLDVTYDLYCIFSSCYISGDIFI